MQELIDILSDIYKVKIPKALEVIKTQDFTNIEYLRDLTLSLQMAAELTTELAIGMVLKMASEITTKPISGELMKTHIEDDANETI